jgi:hypothetical protein
MCLAEAVLALDVLAILLTFLRDALLQVSIVASYIKERTKNAQFIVISLRNNMVSCEIGSPHSAAVSPAADRCFVLV